MTNALTGFIREQMDARRMRNTDVERASGLSKQLVSKLVNDSRDSLTRPPNRTTLEGFAKAFNVPVEILLAKAVEALGLGFESGDFVYDLDRATNEELLGELSRRLGSSPVVYMATGSGKTESFTALTQAARQGAAADVQRDDEHDKHLHKTQDDHPDMEPR